MRLVTVVGACAALAAPLAAQDYHFSKQLAPGARLEVSNINGAIEVSRAAGRLAEVTVTKTVKRGDGSTVKAIMEESGNGIHVCTIYTNRDPDRRTCSGDNNNDSRRGDRSEVEMHYVVRAPADARLVVDNVNGTVTVTGAGPDAKIETVNGDINFDGVGALSLETVNGKVIGRFSAATWEGAMSVSNVNGLIDLTFPASLSADVDGETVNGSVNSDFPITVDKGFGAKSFSGRIGSGGRRLKLETVNGGITLRRR